LSSSAMGRMALPRKPRVIIIGAGLAGLSAALELRRQKIDVIVLESRSRIGGRVFSHNIDKNLVIELGGEWVGNSHERIHHHCHTLGLELFNNQMDTHLVYKGQYSPAGEWDYSERWKMAFQKIITDYPQLSEDDKKALDNMDWWRYLVNNGCEGRDLDIRDLLDSTDFGESIRHVSAFAALAEYAESSPHNEMDLKIRGGNGLLAQRMAERIGMERILTRHSVIRVDQDRKITVSCDNGKVFSADKLICTIPTFALSRIDWRPGLPADQMAAINELQYARINKHALLFKDRFWGPEAFDLLSDQLPHYFYHATRNQDSKKGVLIAYATGV
jgi:monoamine oxidase